jgi:hypothetical protein
MSVGGKAKEEKIWDVVVIGLGGVGSFALRACAKKKSSSADAAAALCWDWRDFPLGMNMVPVMERLVSIDMPIGKVPITFP